jgi:tetratricopeptide (TPR) repeat protein
MTRFLKNCLVLLAGVAAFSSPALLFAGAAQDFDQAGQALYRAGQYEKSIQYFNNAVEADPNDAQAYEDMGNAYMKLDDKPNALASYQKALNLNPNDPTLQTLVDNLSGQMGDNTPAEDNAPEQSQSSQPAPQTYSVTPGRPQLPVVLKPAYNDNFAPLNHAHAWSSLSLGYAYSSMTDLLNAVNATNQAITTAIPPESGMATFNNNGVDLDLQYGFQFNPTSGVALGIGYHRNSDLNLSIDFNNGGDFETLNLQPQVVPLTIDYFLFLPDHTGRFFISAGLGYYYGDVRADKNYDYSIAEGTPDADEYRGDLVAGGLGFQASIGREFAVTDRVSVSLFAKGYYAKLTNFQGTLVDDNGYGGQYGLAVLPDGSLDVQPTGQIGGGSGARYATVDFTGFDVGMSVNFYSF